MATYLFAHINWSSAGAFALFYFLRSNTKTVPSEAEAPTWKFVKGDEFQNGKTSVMSHSFLWAQGWIHVFFFNWAKLGMCGGSWSGQWLLVIHYNIRYNSDYLVSLWVPADLKDAPGSLVRVDQLPVLGAPDVDTPVGQESKEAGMKRLDKMRRGYLSKLPLARNFPSGENATL